MVFSLKEVMNAMKPNEDTLYKALSSFKAVNTKSKDEVESFLRLDACQMERDGQSATYLIVNEQTIDDGQIQIDGYFTVAIKTFHFNDSISKRKRKKISGKTSDYIPAYLIGQLAKSESAPKGIGVKYLEEAIRKIKIAINAVGGRLIYLDCEDELVDYYKRNQFAFLQKDEEKGLNQMYLII